jgi:hypothetical protein
LPPDRSGVEPVHGHGRLGSRGLQRLRLLQQRVGVAGAGPGVAYVHLGDESERSDDLLLRGIRGRQRRERFR